MNRELQPQINKNRKLLGISNTKTREGTPLSHAEEHLQAFLRTVHQLTFIPYALHDMDGLLERMTRVFERFGVKSVTSPHQFPGDEQKVIQDAEVMYLNGGNTGLLVANLHALRHYNGRMVDRRPNAAYQPLVDAIREKAAAGVGIIGTSAGFNVISADVRTTNDMQAAVQEVARDEKVLRIDALGLLPETLNINPHYIEKVDVSDEVRAEIAKISPEVVTILNHQGESREERIRQILEADPMRVVLAIREGSYIVVEGMQMMLHGKTGGKVFRSGAEPQEIRPGEKLHELLVEKKK